MMINIKIICQNIYDNVDAYNHLQGSKWRRRGGVNFPWTRRHAHRWYFHRVPTMFPPGDIPTLFKHMCSVHVIFAAFYWKCSDRILEAEKICDKQEMEQFPNEGDDLQVLYSIVIQIPMVSNKHFSIQVFLQVQYSYFKGIFPRRNSNLLLSANLPPSLSGPSIFLTSLNFPSRIRSSWRSFEDQDDSHDDNDHFTDHDFIIVGQS